MNVVCHTLSVLFRGSVFGDVAMWLRHKFYDKIVLEQHGWEGVQVDLNKLTKLGYWEKIPELFSDEMLETIAVTGTPDEVSAQIYERYEKLATRIAPSIFSGDPAMISALIAAIKKL